MDQTNLCCPSSSRWKSQAQELEDVEVALGGCLVSPAQVSPAASASREGKFIGWELKCVLPQDTNQGPCETHRLWTATRAMFPVGLSAMDFRTEILWELGKA